MPEFRDRRAAGQKLAEALAQYKDQPNVIVLGLPRGGVVVAFEITKALNLPLDILLVRKIGAPFDRELAVGAIAYPDACILNQGLIDLLRIPSPIVNKIIMEERAELSRRNKTYRKNREPPKLTDRTVIIVDDGIATGSDMQAAVEAVTAQKPAKIVIAVPVSSIEAVNLLKEKVDEIICPVVLQHMMSVGSSYGNFAQVEDNEVLAILDEAWREKS